MCVWLIGRKKKQNRVEMERGNDFGVVIGFIKGDADTSTRRDEMRRDTHDTFGYEVSWGNNCSTPRSWHCCFQISAYAFYSMQLQRSILFNC